MHSDCPLKDVDFQKKLKKSSYNWVTIASVIFTISIIFACGGFANKIDTNSISIAGNQVEIKVMEARINSVVTRVESSAATQQAMAQDLAQLRLDTSEIRKLIFDTLKNLQKKE